MSNAEKVNVLMVDDHPENLLALEAVLNSLGQNLVRANSGEEALRCLLNQDFAVILLDVQMPGMDGFETANLIRQRERSRHTPIIFLTAFSRSEQFVFKGYSLGAVDYLLKPIDAEILKSKVSVFIDLCQKNQEVKKQADELAAINAELRETEERFRCLSACSPVGIFLTNTKGNCTYTNPRYQAITGINLPETLGDGWKNCIYPEDREEVLKKWHNYVQKGREYSQEFRIFVKSNLGDKTEVNSSNPSLIPSEERIIRWVHLRSSPMLSDLGKLIGYVGTMEDITERKQAEEARAAMLREQIARQQAEAANRMKDEFLATLSHELRTPLNSILGWARLLRTRSFNQETADRALETIERNAKLQAQLIEDILDVSRIVRGKLRLNLCPVNLVSILQSAIDSVCHQAENKNIQIQTIVDPDVSLISGDPNRLQQVIWNLVSNAIKFTPEGGKIEVKLEQADPYVKIKVSDTGIGISKDFLPYVFDRFRQADGKTTRSYGGLGLGLAIVHHLVQLHGGIVQADSAGEGKGATFTVQLPLSRQVGEEESKKLGEQGSSGVETPGSEVLPENLYSNRATTIQHKCLHPAPGCCSSAHILNGLRVLVVDDDPDVREFVAVVLEDGGAKVTAVASASEALKTIKKWQPDVLVSDIGMPEEDGYAFIRKVRNSERKGRFLPAAALTAYIREEDRTKALEAGFQIHLSKPIDSRTLVNAIADLAGRTVNQY
ncbi:MAG TPA: response regulator [Leptolyngbyaceae cyanobacterium]